MSHRDSKSLPRYNYSLLKEALVWMFSRKRFSHLPLRGDCTYNPRLLATVALLWAWGEQSTLTERFENARRIGIRLLSPGKRVADSYQAFCKLLIRWSGELLLVLQTVFRDRMQHSFSDHWQTEGVVLLGVDGSKLALPRTRELQEFSTAREHNPNQKSSKSPRQKSQSAKRKANNPQLLLTTLWHAGTGLVWDWRCGPRDASERHHLLEMLPSLPRNAVLTGDAGFVGYDFLKQILESGRDVLIRVGANVNLLQQLGYAREYQHTVSLWPDQAARKQQAPLLLRLVVAQQGKQAIFIVTSLKKSNFSDARVLACYRKRWGIEVYYRNFKRTFGRHKLKSKTVAMVEVELLWSLLSLWAMSLYALHQLQEQGIALARLSCASMLRAYRQVMRDFQHRVTAQETLNKRLIAALIDQYERKNKSNRGYPRKKRMKPPGRPKLRQATTEQQQLAQLQKTIIQQKG